MVDEGVDGIARGPRDIGDDRAVGSEQAVGERRLTHVGASDDGDREVLDHIVLVIGLLGERRDDLIEQISRPVSVERGERHRLADAERPELPELLILVVGVIALVDHEEDGLVALAQDARDLLVLVGHADRAIHDEDDDIGLVACGERLLADARGEAVGGFDRFDAAGVDEHEGAPVPVGGVVRTVAGDAARLVDDGIPCLG